MKGAQRASWRSFAAVASCLLFGCATDRIEQGSIRAAVVSGVVEIQSAIPVKSKFYPWEEPKEGEIVVSNASGLGSGVYRAWASDDPNKSLGLLRVRFSKGEWREVREFAFDTPTLLILRRWRGNDYLLDRTQLIGTSNRRRFIVDRSFIAKWDLSILMKPISNEAACMNSEYIAPADLRTFARENDATVQGGEVCFTNGVEVADLAKHFSGGFLPPSSSARGLN